MKLYAIFGFILIAVIITLSVVFTQGMYQSAAQESNSSQDYEGQTVTKYEMDYSWAMFIGVLAIIFVIALVFALFMT